MRVYTVNKKTCNPAFVTAVFNVAVTHLTPFVKHIFLQSLLVGHLSPFFRCIYSIEEPKAIC
jgi:hypothetical protein